jgi:hypothetical protein
MNPLTPEQREYKERTLTQLLVNLPLLEAQLAQQTERNAILSLHEQIADVEAHIARLQKELDGDVLLEPVADELCRQVASALTKQKFYMARRYLNKLETIEPFYPELARLKLEAETGQVSRRTRSLAQSGVLPTVSAGYVPRLPAPSAASNAGVVPQLGPMVAPASGSRDDQRERGGIRQLFQFHIIASCLVIILLACVMASVGGMSVLRWLIEGS